MTFTQLPIIDLKLADDPATKPQLLATLKHALFSVGFLYVVNHGMEAEAEALLNLTPKAFDVPTTEQKLGVAMTKSPHFVGYTGLGAETTNKATDLREQYDFGDATETLEDADENTEDQWKRLTGPSPFLSDDVLPGFKTTVTKYTTSMGELATRFLILVSECLNLPPDTLLQFKGTMNRLKLVKYPPSNYEDSPVKSATLHGGARFQGVGPHKDSSNLFTFVLQDTVGGLEVLNHDGQWIGATPIPGSFVVNIAQGFEALTGGRCGATTHQVVSPGPGITRYSIPYFHSVRMDLTREMIADQLSFISGKIPEPKDAVKRSVDVQSEFINPQYKNVSTEHNCIFISNLSSLVKRICATELSVTKMWLQYGIQSFMKNITCSRPNRKSFPIAFLYIKSTLK